MDYIIADHTVIFMNARNPLEERMYHVENGWTKKFQDAKKYSNVVEAITEAKKLQEDAPVSVMGIEINNNNVKITPINF